MKYIVYENNGKEHMITFPGDASEPQHKEIADALGLEKIVSAGFSLDIAGRKKFLGESFTLGIESRGEIDRDLYIEQSKR